VARDAHGRAIRISFAHYTTTADIDRCFDVVDAASERQPQGVTG
jgi:selenocysteine lyase/cysteine desulfurase